MTNTDFLIKGERPRAGMCKQSGSPPRPTDYAEEALTEARAASQHAASQHAASADTPA